MRIPKAIDLKRNSFKYNRKKQKQDIRKDMKSIFKLIRHLSKKGVTHHQMTADDRRESFWDNMITLRWIRRYSKLDVSIREDDVIIANDGTKLVGRIWCTIKW